MGLFTALAAFGAGAFLARPATQPIRASGVVRGAVADVHKFFVEPATHYQISRAGYYPNVLSQTDSRIVYRLDDYVKGLRFTTYITRDFVTKPDHKLKITFQMLGSADVVLDYTFKQLPDNRTQVEVDGHVSGPWLLTNAAGPTEKAIIAGFPKAEALLNKSATPAAAGTSAK